MDIVLQGKITTDEISPLATSPMEIPGEINKQIKYKEGGPRTQRLPRMPIHVAGADPAYTAYFPSTGIRGHLRRLARSIFHSMHGGGFDIDELRYLTIGGVKGSDSEAFFDLSKAQGLRNALPLISLFGATSDLGQSWVSGKLSVHSAIPYSPLSPTIINGVRSDDLRRDPNEVEYLTADAALNLTARANAERAASGLRRDLKAAKTDLKVSQRAKDEEKVKEIELKIGSIEKSLKDISENSGKDVSVQMPLDGYEAIPPGTDLRSRFVLRGATEPEIGIFLMAINEWACNQGLGAHAAHGCGVVLGDWEVMVSDGGIGDNYRPIGRIAMTPYVGTEFIGEELATLYKVSAEAFKASAESLNGQSLRAVLDSL